MANLEKLRRKARLLPLLPGVYIMKNSSGKIIYIGKAKKLKNRVSQYFNGVERHTAKVYSMVSQVDDFDYILCDSEFEALILECSLIKLHRPKYNIKLKDDTGYSYIRIDSGEWPKIEAVRRKGDDEAEYLGPYSSYFVVNKTVDEARKIFRLPSCSKVFPRDIGKTRPCLNSHIGLCMGVCGGKISEDEYNEAFADAVRFIKNGRADDERELTRRMNEAAEKLEFERAARLRDRIAAIRRSREKQDVISGGAQRVDVIAAAVLDDACAVAALIFKDGRLADMFTGEFPLVATVGETEAGFMQQYYDGGKDIPPEIYTDRELEDADSLSRWLGEKRGASVRITVPKAGHNRRLVEMCLRNAEELLAREHGFRTGTAGALEELARLLGLERAPEYIEAYDISNNAGSDNVGGMVVFLRGKPYKAGYRKFRIKTVAGQDDFRSMAEMLDRRLTEYGKSGESGSGFGRLPDLILIDGGEPQLAAVRPIIKKHGVDVPVFGMVKDGKHRTDAVAGDGGKIEIKANRRAFTLLTEIQNEVHRFAVGYHHASAKKRTLTSSLTAIPGIGEKKAAALLKSFKTLSAVRDAGKDDLAAVPGITSRDAENIVEFFAGKTAGAP